MLIIKSQKLMDEFSQDSQNEQQIMALSMTKLLLITTNVLLHITGTIFAYKYMIKAK